VTVAGSRRGALPRVAALHKPKGVLVSRVAEAGAPTVASLLAEPYRGWWCVGRLDKDSEGLLLLCDDPRWAQRLMDPGRLAKTYQVTVRGLPTEEDLAPMRRGGLLFDGHPLLPVEVRRLGCAPRGGTRVEVVLHEGRHRQIRRLFLQAGHRVRRLVRVAVGTVRLGELPPGGLRELSPEEVEMLTRDVGEQSGSGAGG
jgi:23S rRNA pseudouridine2605 synthase